MGKLTLTFSFCFSVMFSCIVYAQKSSGSVNISAIPAYNWLKYHANDINSEGAFDVGFGITYRHKFHDYFHFAFGVNYRKYHGFIDFNGMRDSVHLVEDSEGHKYFLYQIFNNTEEQTVVFLEPNIRVEYVLPLTSAIEFIAGLGLAFGINLAETNRMTSGTYRRYAWYYENHNTIDFLESMNLATFDDFLNPLPGKTFKNSLLALGEIGFRFNISPNLQILTLFVVQHSLMNVHARRDHFIHHWSYSGIAASEIPKGVHAVSAGLELGLSCRIPIIQRPKKPQKIRGAHCP